MNALARPFVPPSWGHRSAGGSALVSAIVFAVAIAAGAVVVLSTARAPAPLDPDVVARVNGEAVTREALHRLLSDVYARRELEQELAGASPGAENSLEALALEELIERRLLVQEARLRGFTVTEDEVDLALVNLRRRFPGLEQFGEWIKARGLDELALIESLRTDLLISKAWDALVADVAVSEEQVRAYYDDRKDSLRVSEAVRLQIIAVGDERTAQSVMAGLGAGEEFDRLARRFSSGSRATQGGDTGWVKPDELPAALRKAISGLEPGAVAAPVVTAPGYRIVRVAERRAARILTFAEARPVIEQRLLPDAQREALERWLDEQKSIARIERGAPTLPGQS